MTRRRPKLKDVARLSGVSAATVDRVVNQRSGVQDHTRQHVLSVLSRLSGDAARVPSLDDGSAETKLRLDFIIPDNGNAFMSELIAQLQDHAELRRDVTLTFHRPAGIEAARIANQLSKVGDRTQGVGLIGLDKPVIRDAARDLVKRGVPVVTMASDIRNVPRLSYVGIDNHAAGRLAGYLTGRLTRSRPSKVALILGSRDYLGHAEREMGFRSVLRESFPELEIIAEREIEEDSGRARKAVIKLLKDNPDLSAIYCIGAGQPGIAEAIDECGRAGSIFFVGHGLSSDTRRFLSEGTMDVVIDEDTKMEAREAIDCLVRASRGENAAPLSSIRINAVFRENIPADY